MTTSSPMPFVSVIVPVYNGAGHIRACVESLLAQDYPKDRYEVVVADNGSTDETPDIVRSFPVTFLAETKRGSYAARNTAVRAARGGVFVFTDADCRARPDWLSAGVRYLTHGAADFAGGAVSFSFSPRRTAAEQWDALSSFDQEATIAEKGTAVTANLFVPRRVFEAVGPFREVRSGGDYEWTSRAGARGFKLGFCKDAVVEHPARGFAALLEKSFRVGTGAVMTWRSRNKSWLWVAAAAASCTLPVIWWKMPALAKRRGWRGSPPAFVRMALVAYAGKLVTFCGIVASLVRRGG